jgi:hypothetical protein
MSDPTDRKAAYRWCAEALATAADADPNFIDEANPVLREVNRIIKAMGDAGEVPETTVAAPATPVTTNGANGHP